MRLDINNSNEKLKPEMFANVEISGKDFGLTPVIPENAVIRSGTKDIVILSLGDGKFKPQTVTLGGYSNGYYQVLKGLTAGSKIVISAQFLIDSESNLKSAIGMMQDTPPDSSTPEKQMDMKKDKEIKKPKEKNKPNSESEIKQNKKVEATTENIVRTGVIDLQAIDKNNDGKLFQDEMDWNVISDKFGKCTLCGMTLTELPIEQVKKNLIENGFKVKE